MIKVTELCVYNVTCDGCRSKLQFGLSDVKRGESPMVVTEGDCANVDELSCLGFLLGTTKCPVCGEVGKVAVPPNYKDAIAYEYKLKNDIRSEISGLPLENDQFIIKEIKGCNILQDEDKLIIRGGEITIRLKTEIEKMFAERNESIPVMPL